MVRLLLVGMAKAPARLWCRPPISGPAQDRLAGRDRRSGGLAWAGRALA